MLMANREARLTTMRRLALVVLASGLAAACGDVSVASAPGSTTTPVPLTEKEQIEQRIQQDRLVSPAPKGDPQKERPPVAVTNPPAPTGVLDTSVAPFPAVEFLATNRWNGFVGDHLVAVIAGGPANTQLARLAVLTFDREGVNVLDVMWVELPGSPGRPRVASAAGASLVITTQSGQTYAFDADTKRLSTLP